MKIKSVLLLGLGGTGSFLIEPLCRLLKESQVYVMDGDFYSKKNENRQSLNHKFNKATATKLKLKKANLNVSLVPNYISEHNISDIFDKLEEPCVIINSVDKDYVRKLTLEKLREAKKDYIWISPGNDYSDGQVNTVISKSGKEITNDPLTRYDNLANPKDTSPDNDCIEESEQRPQLLVANYGAAWITLCVLNSIIEDLSIKEELLYDCEKFKIRGNFLCQVQNTT